MDHILAVVCDEPTGPVVRRVYPMTLTAENLKQFWEKSKNLRTVFAGEVSGDFKKFVELFMSQGPNGIRAHGLFWVVDDFVGLFYIDKITEVDASAHFIFFDGRFKGRHELTREMIRYVFRKFGFQRLNAELPLYVSGAVIDFVKTVGFQREGKKRKAVRYKDNWYDALCLGLLKSEAIENGTDA